MKINNKDCLSYGAKLSFSCLFIYCYKVYSKFFYLCVIYYKDTHNHNTMKRNHIIYLSLLIYAILAICFIFIANIYVDKKDIREHKLAIDNLEQFFANQKKFVMIDYSGEKVAYEKAAIPKTISEEKEYGCSSSYFISEEDKMNWKERWTNVYKLYKLRPRFEPKEGLFHTERDNSWTGWCFRVIEKTSYDIFTEYLVYPYQVAYYRQNYSWEYSYMPSVQSAIDESFEFHTHNEESSYSQYIKHDNDALLSYDIKDAVLTNDYWKSYYIAFSYDEYVNIVGKEVADSVLSSRDWNKISNFGVWYSKVDKSDKKYFGGMHNNYYRVDNMCQPIYNWIITYNFIHNPKIRDKRLFIIWSECSLLVLLLAIITPISIIDSKKRKFANESIRGKLLKLCNPQNFMKPYDEKKVYIANELYDRLLKTLETDIDTLKEIRREAVLDLKINFIDSDRLKELRAKTNPQKFMKPYNAEKVKIANDLYMRLNAQIDIDALEEIEREINEKLLSN